MENNHPLNSGQTGIQQGEILNRVNQTYEKIAKDVKNMITENKQENEETLS